MILALTGGGTMGHISPNLALLPELKKRFSKIIYIGSKGSMEEKKAQENGIPFFAVPVVKFNRKNLLSNLKIPFTLRGAKKQVVEILKQEKVDIVFAKGGFVSVPVMLGAKKAKIPYILHESDMTLGLANRLGAHNAKQIFVATEKAKENLPQKYKAKTIVTGIPVRDEFSKKTSTIDSQKLRTNTNKKILLVTGGSQGAKTINDLIRNNLDSLTKSYHIIHITGKGNTNPKLVQKDYEQIEFTNNMPSLMHQADVMISRGGATTIFEGIKAHVPMLIIPLKKSKSSRGDQVENAKYFHSQNILEFIEEENLNISSLLKKLQFIDKNSQKFIRNMHSSPVFSLSNAKIAEIIINATTKNQKTK